MNDSANPVSTPCVKICVVDPVSALCIGCGRSVAEISLWRETSEAQRQKIMAELPERLAKARSRGARGRQVGRDRRAGPWR